MVIDISTTTVIDRKVYRFFPYLCRLLLTEEDKMQ